MAGTSTSHHPVLDMQAELQRPGSVDPDGFFSELGEAIDATPRFLAGLVLGSALTLYLLKSAGIRFNFGVGANVG